MQNYISKYMEIIAKNGIRNTKQKEYILLELISSSTHLTAEQIHQRVKERKIGLATIYRNLKLFESLGIVKEIPSGGTSYYELKLFARKPLHIHFKCLKCNCMTDMDDSEITMEYVRLNQKVEKKLGAEVMDADITLLGICSACKAKFK
ncbi:Fur family transcriptional regulator [Parasporobacterium paucivorans]|uniref:Fe2+ or Zn2+ uptake regulation protein n=1 Tax=Parasporobacterium paucivorans DSM 15970 TaxID=1122934 RepID=A0A1M6I571_9FIRM|nr:Fur family transcriptional regulator [Parasporobacterium paucivorans]SHJ29588.1 Fe2+ or Zn2+ uptake regulation protein [Parasporobacterium paucivorans DSM 15970]